MQEVGRLLQLLLLLVENRVVAEYALDGMSAATGRAPQSPLKHSQIALTCIPSKFMEYMYACV